MAFEKCPICQKWDVGQHRCPPLFMAWCEEQSETEDDAQGIYASDAQSAAEQWAEDDDCYSAEYMIVGQKWEPVLTVKDTRDGEVKRFTVTGEAVPSYSATEVTAPKEDSDQ